MVEVIVQRLKCSNIDEEYFELQQCQVKPGWNRKGVIFGIGNIKKPVEPWVIFHIFITCFATLTYLSIFLVKSAFILEWIKFTLSSI